VNIQFDPILMTAFFLALVRATAWIFSSPPFNSNMIPTAVKAGIAAALALAIAPHIKDPSLSLDTAPFIGALLSQVLIGLSLGMLTQLLFGAISAGGSLIDLFAGYSLAAVFDPISDHQAATFGRLYELLATTLLFATNAHLILVNGFFRSFEAIPAGAVTPGAVSKLLTDNLGVFLVSAIEVAGPVLACLFLAELTLGLLARAAPSLNVFSLAFPLRVAVALLVVAIALPLIGPALGNLVHASVSPFGG
jgi:flagellar biosynthetic protein FliR